MKKNIILIHKNFHPGIMRKDIILMHNFHPNIMKKDIILTPALDKETHGKAPQKDHNRHDANLS